MTHSQSSIRSVPEVTDIPKHIAIIMDGNGRWARRRMLPRVAGHRQGSEAVRALVKNALRIGIPCITLFAFSSENWRRPSEEVSLLMQLFITNLEKEMQRLHDARVRIRIIGEVSMFGERLRGLIQEAEALTRENDRLVLTIAANYGGRCDILQATNRLLAERPEVAACGISEADLSPYLSLGDLPEPDLFIRTGGEQRISNFLLWQLAYTELYFTDVLWPDFDGRCLEEAIRSYQQRERRFGRTSEQCYEQGS